MVGQILEKPPDFFTRKVLCCGRHIIELKLDEAMRRRAKVVVVRRYPLHFLKRLKYLRTRFYPCQVQMDSRPRKDI
ncbi:MAG: hypothetical protein ACE5NG_17735 [bacterium]